MADYALWVHMYCAINRLRLRPHENHGDAVTVRAVLYGATLDVLGVATACAAVVVLGLGPRGVLYSARQKLSGLRRHGPRAGSGGAVSCTIGTRVEVWDPIAMEMLRDFDRDSTREVKAMLDAVEDEHVRTTAATLSGIIARSEGVESVRFSGGTCSITFSGGACLVLRSAEVSADMLMLLYSSGAGPAHLLSAKVDQGKARLCFACGTDRPQLTCSGFFFQ